MNDGEKDTQEALLSEATALLKAKWGPMAAEANAEGKNPPSLKGNLTVSDVRHILTIAENGVYPDNGEDAFSAQPMSEIKTDKGFTVDPESITPLNERDLVEITANRMNRQPLFRFMTSRGGQKVDASVMLTIVQDESGTHQIGVVPERKTLESVEAVNEINARIRETGVPTMEPLSFTQDIPSDQG